MFLEGMSRVGKLEGVTDDIRKATKAAMPLYMREDSLWRPSQ